MSADVDARLDLLSLLRERGFAGHDITLTESGHDFVVCLDAMQRLLAASPGPLVGPAEDGQFHDAELDAAIEGARKPDELPICSSALVLRRDALIDHQLASITNEQEQEECRRDLMRQGKPFDRKAVEDVLVRSVLGGSFTFGIAVGLTLGQRLVPAGGTP